MCLPWLIILVMCQRHERRKRKKILEKKLHRRPGIIWLVVRTPCDSPSFVNTLLWDVVGQPETLPNQGLEFLFFYTNKNFCIMEKLCIKGSGCVLGCICIVFFILFIFLKILPQNSFLQQILAWIPICKIDINKPVYLN